MSVKSEIFKMLDENIEPVDIMAKLKINSATMAQYKYMWKKERGIASDAPKTADELADKLFSDFDKKNEVKAEAPKKENIHTSNSRKRGS